MINCMPVTGKPDSQGLYMRVRVDRRNLRSSFAMGDGDTLNGLFQSEKTAVEGQKDMFFRLDEIEYSSSDARARLRNKLRSLSLSADSQKIKSLIDNFFETSKKLKREAANKYSSLTVAQAAVLQNEINKSAVSFNCATISLLRIEESETEGLRFNRDQGLWKREERFCKVYFSKDQILTEEFVATLLDAVSGIAIEADIKFVFGTKTVNSNGNRREVLTITREVTTNREEVAAQQAAKSTIDECSYVGHQRQAPERPKSFLGAMMEMAAGSPAGSVNPTMVGRPMVKGVDIPKMGIDESPE